MRIPKHIRVSLNAWALRKMANEKPSVVIGPSDNPYLHRWHVIPRNRFFNIYLHRFFRSDDDRALHDHPWANCSILIAGDYTEWTREIDEEKTAELKAKAIKENMYGYVVLSKNVPHERKQGFCYFRRASVAHRVELIPMMHFKGSIMEMMGCPAGYAPVTTLFITGPKVRDWGFHCPKGWVPWEKFTDISEDGANIVGKGCDQ